MKVELEIPPRVSQLLKDIAALDDCTLEGWSIKAMASLAMGDLDLQGDDTSEMAKRRAEVRSRLVLIVGSKEYDSRDHQPRIEHILLDAQPVDASLANQVDRIIASAERMEDGQ